jgi:hypothetical protein
MAVTPNRGSLVKAGIASGPKWGGSWGQIVALCDAHALKVPDVAGYTADICKAELAYQAYNSGRDRATVDDTVKTSDHPVLKRARIQRILATEDTSEAARRLLEEYLFDVTVTDTDAASYLDAFFYRKEQRPLVSFDVWSRKMAKARADLQYDPYDGDIISTLMFTNVNRRDLAPALTPADTRGLHARALMLAPYDLVHWIGLGFAIGTDTDPLAADRFFENAAVFSNFAPYFIGYSADHKAGQ